MLIDGVACGVSRRLWVCGMCGSRHTTQYGLRMHKARPHARLASRATNVWVWDGVAHVRYTKTLEGSIDKVSVSGRVDV